MKKQMRNSQLSSLNYKRKNLTSLPFILCMSAPKMEHIDISENFLTTINEFSQCQFIRLRTLYLNNNMIDNISGLASGQFSALQKLFLFGNQLQNLTPLHSINAPNLLQLKLGFKNNGNKINDQTMIDLGQKSNFPLLEELTLDYNQIQRINFLQKWNLQNLTVLYLSGNKIESIDPVYLNNLTKLRSLSFKNNSISNIKFMKRMNLPELEYLNIGNNFISQLNSIECASIKMITRLTIYDNLINDCSICIKCDWPEASQISKDNFRSIIQRSLNKQLYKKYLMTS